MLSDECHRILLMTSQHWFKWWLGVVRHQAITWASVNLDPGHHMVSLGHKELSGMGAVSIGLPPTGTEQSHSVESPSMVDPQWDIRYWGSKWNLHTVCWSAVGCEWGTTSVYFGITYVCFVPSRLPVFAVEPQYLLQNFLFLSKVSFEGHIQNLQKNSCCFKI